MDDRKFNNTRQCTEVHVVVHNPSPYSYVAPLVVGIYFPQKNRLPYIKYSVYLGHASNGSARSCMTCLKGRMLKAEETETLLCGRVTWTVWVERFAKLRTAYYQIVLRVSGFQHRLRTDYTTLSNARPSR